MEAERFENLGRSPGRGKAGEKTFQSALLDTFPGSRTSSCTWSWVSRDTKEESRCRGTCRTIHRTRPLAAGQSCVQTGFPVRSVLGADEKTIGTKLPNKVWRVSRLYWLCFIQILAGRDGGNAFLVVASIRAVGGKPRGPLRTSLFWTGLGTYKPGKPEKPGLGGIC